MAQIFPKWANRVPALALGGLVVTALVVSLGIWYYFSPEFTDVGYRPRQPVPYSHALHVGELGLDCRYCHAQVEVAAVASVPPTKVCLNCHQLVARDKESLAPIFASMADREPMRWVRVHNVPDYAYFDHSVHIRAGVGCSSCHGDVAAMEVIELAEPLSMSWCLDCHRDPARHLRPREEITNTRWQPSEDQSELGLQLAAERGLAPPEDCNACHR